MMTSSEPLPPTPTPLLSSPSPSPDAPAPNHKASSSARRRPPPAKITTAPLTRNNVGTVKRLNSVIFPISYSPKFYSEILDPALEEFNRLVYYNDVPIACICCRIMRTPGTDSAKLYLATMGVLAPYRSLTIGHQTISLLLASAAASTSPRITALTAHVQVSNTDARRFYEREGFVEVGLAKGYYQKIEPADAWVLEREVVQEKGEGAKGKGKGKGKERED